VIIDPAYCQDGEKSEMIGVGAAAAAANCLAFWSVEVVLLLHAPNSRSIAEIDIIDAAEFFFIVNLMLLPIRSFSASIFFNRFPSLRFYVRTVFKKM